MILPAGPTPRRGARPGFTLLEVLIAIALILALSAGLLSYIWGLLGSRDRLITATDQQISAEAMYEQLETDLATTFAADGSGAAGIEGSATSLIVRARGVGSLAGGGISDLGDTQGCEVKFDSASRELTARRLGKPDETFETLASPVERVRIRYFEDGAWKDSFNSASAGTLPVAVEVALWFDSGTTATEAKPSRDAHEPHRQSGARANSTDEPTPTPDANDAAPERAPDRVRVMVIPDGPVTSWKSHV